MNTYLTADTIRALREGRGLTQRALAEAIGVTDKAVSNGRAGAGCPTSPSSSPWRARWVFRSQSCWQETCAPTPIAPATSRA